MQCLALVCYRALDKSSTLLGAAHYQTYRFRTAFSTHTQNLWNWVWEKYVTLCFNPEAKCLRAQNYFFLTFDFDILFSSRVRRKSKFWRTRNTKEITQKEQLIIRWWMLGSTPPPRHVGNGLKTWHHLMKVGVLWISMKSASKDRC